MIFSSSFSASRDVEFNRVIISSRWFSTHVSGPKFERLSKICSRSFMCLARFVDRLANRSLLIKWFGPVIKCRVEMSKFSQSFTASVDPRIVIQYVYETSSSTLNQVGMHKTRATKQDDFFLTIVFHYRFSLCLLIQIGLDHESNPRLCSSFTNIFALSST